MLWCLFLFWIKSFWIRFWSRTLPILGEKFGLIIAQFCGLLVAQELGLFKHRFRPTFVSRPLPRLGLWKEQTSAWGGCRPQPVEGAYSGWGRNRPQPVEGADSAPVWYRIQPCDSALTGHRIRPASDVYIHRIRSLIRAYFRPYWSLSWADLRVLKQTLKCISKVVLKLSL